MAKIKQQRAQSSTLSSQVTYLNCAYMSPLLKTVEKARHSRYAEKEKSDAGIA
jgi:hypothetical protein